MITFFLISILFLLFIGHFKKIDSISMYGFFILFSILYNLIPALNANYGISFFSLSSNLDLINIQLLAASISNFVFGSVYYAFYKNIPYCDTITIKTRGRKYFMFYCVLLFAITSILAKDYGWHSYTFAGEITDEGSLFTITSYLKYLFASSYLFYLYKFGLNKGAIFLMILHTILMLIDGARTTFLPLLLLTLVILQSKQSKNSKNKYRIPIVIFISLFLILVTRALVMSVDETLFFNMLMSLTIEACAGSYMSLQTIYAIINNATSSFTYGTTYMFDPIAWFVPQGALRDSLLTYNAWTDRLSPVLVEKFAPMGGFYYIAEAMAAAPYVGPIVITAIFAFVTTKIEINKNKYKLLYLSFFSTIGILFSKSIFGNVMKLFLIQLLFLGIFKLLSDGIIFPRKYENR